MADSAQHEKNENGRISFKAFGGSARLVNCIRFNCIRSFIIFNFIRSIIILNCILPCYIHRRPLRAKRLERVRRGK